MVRWVRVTNIRGKDLDMHMQMALRPASGGKPGTSRRQGDIGCGRKLLVITHLLDFILLTK